jgi:hypothetical protein
MKKKEFEKPKEIVFEKLAEKEAEKVKGGDDGWPIRPRSACVV